MKVVNLRHHAEHIRIRVPGVVAHETSLRWCGDLNFAPRDKLDGQRHQSGLVGRRRQA
jgi:hypothetical protein